MIIKIQKEKKNFEWICPYEKYLNGLCKVADGWIIFMDDDAKFNDSKFCFKLSLQAPQGNIY